MRLQYYPDSKPGFGRKRHGRGFSYVAPDGTRVGDEAVKARLRGLAVPPAYSDVWMSLFENGHLQATGRDDRGRKQYRYHPDWAAVQAAQKFDQLAQFGEALPRIRRWITSRLDGDPGEFDFAVAATLALIDRASMRVGAPEYTAQNGSHGATTLENHHVRIDGDSIVLDYPAKGGKQVNKRLHGGKLARALHAAQDLPGADLISYGEGALVRSEHLHEVLSELAGDGISAKTFRTWNGTHAAFCAASETDTPTIKALAEAAAERLHNTATIARNSYIHPKVIALAENGTRATLEKKSPDGLRRGEAGLLKLLG